MRKHCSFDLLVLAVMATLHDLRANIARFEESVNDIKDITAAVDYKELGLDDGSQQRCVLVD